MLYTLGFIGAGNMGGALVSACAKTAGGKNIAVFDKDQAKVSAFSESLGCFGAADAAEAAGKSRYIVLAVKPHLVEGVCREIAPVLKKRGGGFTVITIAAGVSISEIESYLGADMSVMRIMPNTPAFVGGGMILCCGNGNVSEAEFSEFRSLFSEAGRLDKIDENLIDAAACVSGCGPAFAYMFINALADGGVSCGLPRAAAIEYAAQMLLGSAKMVLESGDHPEKLKDNVCSPGGTTIQGVRALEAGGFRSSVFEAVVAAYEKTAELKQGR